MKIMSDSGSNAIELFFRNHFCDTKYFVLTFLGFSSPKEQDSEDSVKPEDVSPNHDWIPPEDQNQPKNSVSFIWLEFTFRLPIGYSRQFV